MIWEVSDATNSNIRTAKASGSGILLGFNEPDNVNQADDTVAVRRPAPCSMPMSWGGSFRGCCCHYNLQMLYLFDLVLVVQRFHMVGCWGVALARDAAHACLQEAIAAWPTLQNSGLRLGSPALSTAQDGTESSSWIGQFMTQVTRACYCK